MSTKTKVVLATVLVLVALAIGLVVFTSGPVDRCLDQGGRWNYALEDCERE